MGRYIDLSDVQRKFGADNIATWSDPNNLNALDTDSVDEAIAWAEDKIDDQFRDSRYRIPFSFIGSKPRTLVYWAVAYAGQWLYLSRGLEDKDAGKRIMILIEGIDGDGGIEAEIRGYLAGKQKLNVARADTMPEAPIAIM